jgi:hypothetical protein
MKKIEIHTVKVNRKNSGDMRMVMCCSRIHAGKYLC